MFPHLETVTTIRSLEHELALKQIGRRRRLAAPRTTFLPLACLLALATGGALLLTAWTVATPASGRAAGRSLAPPTSSMEAVTTVHVFYSAVNDALRTGDLGSVEALLAPDLVEHADRPGLPAGREGLLQYLTRLRAAYPSLQVAVEQVLADGDLVSVQVAARTTGLPASTDDPATPFAGHWRGVDVLRVVNGQIVERWSGSDAPRVAQPLARVPLERWPSGTQVTATGRLTFAPGAGIGGITLPGPGLLVVEAGMLLVRGSGETQVFQGSGDPVLPPRLIPSGTEQALTAGDVVAFPAGTGSLSLRNAGVEPVVTLVVAWLPSVEGQDIRHRPGQLGMAQPPDGDPASHSGLADTLLLPSDGGRAAHFPGVTATPLGSLGSIGQAQVPPGRIVVTLERVLLTPGASVPPLPASGPTTLVVEAGRLGLVPIRETAWVRSPSAQQEAASAGSEIELKAGETAFWDAGTVALVRGGPDTTASALLLAITAEGPTYPTRP